MSLKPSDQPVAYSNALRAVLAALVILGAVTLDGEQVAAIVIAFDAVLGIFIWNAVTPRTRADARVEAATVAGKNAAVAYIGSLPAKPAPRKAAAKKPARQPR